MTGALKHSIFYLISFGFIAVNVCLLFLEQYWIMLVPIVMFLIYIALFSSDKLFMLIVFFTPLSVNLMENTDFKIGVYLPTEPLLAMIMILFLIRVFYDWHYDSKILMHPVSIAIILNLVWIAVCCITSEDPIVSVKFLLARLWFVIPAYFLGTQVFRSVKNIRLFPWLYVIPMMGVVIYSIINLATYGFDLQAAHWVMQPFYADHTQYGAVLAMFYPLLIGALFDQKIAANKKIIIACMLIVISTGLILSYTRAAWLSILVALAVGVIFWLKMRFRTFVILLGFLSILFFSFQRDIIKMLEQNKQESSENLIEHAESISNIASDASNLERINRWHSALRMFYERPFFGWGPGTYAFYYAPFQNSKDKTIISTNFGDRGTAHSEYLGPLAETGMPGALLVLLLFCTVIYTAANSLRNIPDKELRLFVITVLLGLITYFIHGILNNFLDSDKASIPFWGFIAIIVAVDVYHKGNQEDLGESPGTVEGG